MEIGIRDERAEKFNQLAKQQERLEEKLRIEKENGNSEEKIKKIIFDLEVTRKGIRRSLQREYAYF